MQFARGWQENNALNRLWMRRIRIAGNGWHDSPRRLRDRVQRDVNRGTDCREMLVNLFRSVSAEHRLGRHYPKREAGQYSKAKESPSSPSQAIQEFPNHRNSIVPEAVTVPVRQVQRYEVLAQKEFRNWLLFVR